MLLKNYNLGKYSLMRRTQLRITIVVQTFNGGWMNNIIYHVNLGSVLGSIT